MNLKLIRFSYSPTETEGMLFIEGRQAPFFTLEQPWVASKEFPSGLIGRSCVPEGSYDLKPFRRSNGHKVWCLINPALGVVEFPDDNPAHRSTCLIHSGNTVEHTRGCILPGNRRGILKGQRAVLESGFREGYALDLITKALGEMSAGHTLTISQYRPA